MASNTRQTYIATHGNLPVKADNQAIFLPGKGRASLNVMAGELVVFNPKTNLTISAAEIAAQETVVVAVGVGQPGQIATTLRYLGGDGFDLCKDKIEALVTSPVCGTPQVIDVFFDGTECRKSYAIGIYLDDYIVKSNYPNNDRALYQYNVINPCGSDCSCTTENSCEELVCKFVDQINNKATDTDARNIVIFQNRDDSFQYQPFRAARLWDTETSIKTFCLTPQSDDCGNCNSLPAITGITVDGEATVFAATTVEQGGETVTLATQLQRIVDLTNDVLEATGGRAHLTQSIGKCCNYCIEISTCAEVITFQGAEGDADIVVTDESNPFASVQDASICTTCDSSPTTVSATCGFRLYVDPVIPTCMCQYPPNETPPSTYSRTIEVQPLEDWGCQTFYVIQSTEQIIPEGFGYFYQDAEYYQHNGGIGRDYHYSNTHRGEIGLPDASSRASMATTIKCDETYCVYNLKWTKRSNSKGSNSRGLDNEFWTFVTIPYNDTVTKTSWETFLAELHQVGVCITQDITC